MIIFESFWSFLIKWTIKATGEIGKIGFSLKSNNHKQI